MDKKDVLNLLKTNEYSFLRENKYLKENIILLVLGGSMAYGTNNENSDIDIRGITLDLPQDILGLGSVRDDTTRTTRFKQFTDTNTDTVVYSLTRFIELAEKGNPNILEILGVREEDILYINEFGRKLINNKELFLSKRIINTVGNYANSQLRRLENSLARDRIPQTKKEQHIENSIQNFLAAAKGMFTSFDDSSIHIYIDNSTKESLDKELFVDFTLKHYPLRDFHAIERQITDIIRIYDKSNKGHRNSKKDDIHLNKHAMHLVRLYLMGIEMLKEGKLHTYRSNDLDLLLSIRNGNYMEHDGTYTKAFFSIVDKLREEFQKAIENTTLPDRPDIRKIEQLQMELLIHQIIKKEK